MRCAVTIILDTTPTFQLYSDKALLLLDSTEHN